MDHTYYAHPVRVIDADTVVLDVDLGFNVWLRTTFRLFGCNTRERSMAGGAEAGAHVESLLPPDAVVVVTSIRPDKFGGRYLGRITLPDGTDLTQAMVDQGWAAPWDGRGVKPIPPWPRP